MKEDNLDKYARKGGAEMTERKFPYFFDMDSVESHVNIFALELRELQEVIAAVNRSSPWLFEKKRMLSLLQAVKEAADKLEEALKK